MPKGMLGIALRHFWWQSRDALSDIFLELSPVPNKLKLFANLGLSENR